METQELDKILKEQSNLKNLPNSKLIEYMDKLSLDFESTKSEIIKLTLKLDNVELLYNNILKEFQQRSK